MSIVLTTLLGVANVFGAGMIVPQIVRLHRHRTTDGVSVAWVGVGVALNGWWLAYAVATQLWAVLPVSLAGIVLYGTIVIQCLGLSGWAIARPLAFGALLLGQLPLPFLIGWGWTAAGLAIGVAYGIQFAPAAVAAVRADRVAGISPATWTMAWIEAAIWLAYGAIVDDGALIIGGGGGLIASTIVVARLGLEQDRLPSARRSILAAR